MVYETHPKYIEYFKHFNKSSHLFSRAQQSIHAINGKLPNLLRIRFDKTEIFLNAGVLIIDTKRWMTQRLTTRAEYIFQMNHDGGLFNSKAIGDQGVFYLLLGAEAYGLHPRWNMRRSPKKTTELLSDGRTTGIIHLAGTTHGDAGHLCEQPLSYPSFLPAVLPLYLAVIKSFHALYPNEHFSSLQSCLDAIDKIKEIHRANAIHSKYNIGRGSFIL